MNKETLRFKLTFQNQIWYHHLSERYSDPFRRLYHKGPTSSTARIAVLAPAFITSEKTAAAAEGQSKRRGGTKGTAAGIFTARPHNKCCRPAGKHAKADYNV